MQSVSLQPPTTHPPVLYLLWSASIILCVCFLAPSVIKVRGNSLEDNTHHRAILGWVGACGGGSPLGRTILREGEIRAGRVVVVGLNKGREEVWRRMGRDGGFFIHFYDHIDKVSSVPSLLGNTATLSWIELRSWEVRYSYYDSTVSAVLWAVVSKQPACVCQPESQGWETALTKPLTEALK